MRKITSLLMLLCVFVGTAWGQPQVGTQYRIKDTKRSKYLTITAYEQNSGGTHGTVPVLDKEAGNEDQVWVLEAAEDENSYYFKSRSGYYLTLRAWCVDATSSGKGKITIEEAENANEFYLKNGTNFFKVEEVNADNGVAHPFCDAPSNHQNIVTWTFEEVPVDEIFQKKVTVTYKYFIGEDLYTSQEKEVVVNSEVEVPDQAFLTVVNYQGTIGEEDCEITVNCTENLPFVVTADLEAPVWQVVEMHRFNGTFRVWDYVENDADIKVTEMSSNKEGVSDDSKLWCFTGNLIDGFKIYNKKAGTTVTLNATSGTAKVGAAAEGNDVWKLKKSSDTNDPAACFTHDGSNCMNQQGGFINYWSSADNGSTCYFFKPSVKVLEAASAFDGMPLGAVGAYQFTEEQKSAFVAAVNAVVADPDDLNKVKTLSAMIAEAKNLEKIPYTDGYYRIYSAQSGLYANKKGLIFDGSTFKWGTISNDNVDAIVKLTTDNEKVVLQNVNSNLYMQGVAGASNPNMTENGHITLTELGAAQYQLVFGNGTMHASGHGNGAGSTGTVIGHDAGFGSASAWYIIPATDIEVVVGEAGYATTYLPFDVTLGEGVKAYAVTSIEGERAKLTEKTDIPANTAAILEGESTHTLTIADAASDWTGNLLKGTNVPTNIAEKAYVLSMPEGESVGFYAAEINVSTDTTNDGEEGAEDDTFEAFKNNANKAYLPASAVSASARFISFDFGTETAIESIEGAEAENAVVYDLSGRRVQKAQKGVFIVNGKVVIK